MKLYLSGAGQCNNLSRKKYWEMEETNPGQVFVAYLQFVDKNDFRLTLKGHPDGTNAMHTVLLNIPNMDYSRWIVIDPTYSNGSYLRFPEYIKALSSHYEGVTDWIRVSWKNEGDINSHVKDGQLEVEMKDL